MANWDFELSSKKKKRKFIRFEDLILHEDEHVIVANKPVGIACLDDRSEDTNLLLWAQTYCPGVKLCHRLDKYTSGAIIFAKNGKVYREISMQFQRREVVKHYMALVEGVRNFEEFVVEAPLHVTASGRVKINHGVGKEAVTIFDTEETYRDHSLVSCQPLTGRTHQIRVHLFSVGCPIVGDLDYNGKDLLLSDLKRNYKLNRNAEQERPINEGYLLHARGVAFVLPGQEEPSQFIAPLSKNFEVALKILNKWGR